MSVNKLNIYTYLKSNLSVSKHYGYLPPHGKTIRPFDTIAIPGDLFQILANKPRSLKAFANDIADGNLILIATPDVVIAAPAISSSTYSTYGIKAFGPSYRIEHNEGNTEGGAAIPKVKTNIAVTDLDDGIYTTGPAIDIPI